MSITPTKHDASQQFVPREIVTPNKDQPGISKTVFSHVSNLHGLLKDWVKMRDKGVKIFRAVSALKLHECNDDYYPHQLKPLMDTILDGLDIFENVVQRVKVINEQLQALAKLQPTDQAVILTWSATRISECVDNIYKALQNEFRLKQIITENVAHCRDENLIEVYISSWEIETFLTYESNAYLFADVGLTGIC